MPAAGSVAGQLGGGLIAAAGADVGARREHQRQARLRVLALLLGVPTVFLWWRIVDGRPLNLLRLPPMPDDPILWVLPVILVLAIGAMLAMPLLSGRSPHVEYRPEQLEVGFAQVKGLDTIVDEVTKTLNTFLGYATYRQRLGGSPRRGLLFEGPPGTGKTHLAKAMARESGVPFLFVSATSFQSMWYGATARKVRSYFKALRRVARREGGAIGFIEEIDAIATARGGLATAERAPALRTAGSSGCAHAVPGWGPQVAAFSSSEGTGGIVNELLVQMQSFDTPPPGQRLWNLAAGWLNRFLPGHRQLRMRQCEDANILLIAATNRADSLDPALLRPGRFDRRLEFELPAKAGRRDLIDHFLSRKVHAPDLDRDELRDQLAGQTFGATPVMIEHLFDEALVLGLKGGRDGLSWADVQQARLTASVGLANPVGYTDRERRSVATHEAGHATVAHLAGTRRLEVLSIVKRKGSLGLLAHGDLDEVYTRTRKELVDLVDIALGGLCAEELFFGSAGTGPGSDLAYATRIGAEIVGSCGMAGSLVSLAAVQRGALNDENLVGRVLSDPAARPQLDALLEESKRRVMGLLTANRHHVEALRDALLARDELVGEEIADVFATAGPPVLDDLRVERRSGADRRSSRRTAGS
ncbi:MAG: AAA family ATPase [Egibacteraceae bacterium]